MRPLRKWSPPWSQRYIHCFVFFSQHWDLAFEHSFQPAFTHDSWNVTYRAFHHIVIFPAKVTSALIVHCCIRVCHANIFLLLLLFWTVCSCFRWGVVETVKIWRGNIFLLHPVFHGEAFLVYHTPFLGSRFVLNVYWVKDIQQVLFFIVLKKVKAAAKYVDVPVSVILGI